MAKVLRAFDYSFDGVTALKALVGADIDFGDMTAGLVAEGYVSAAPEGGAAAALELEPAQVVPVVEEPDVETVVAEVAADPGAAVVDEVAVEPEPVVVAAVEPNEAPKPRKRK